MVISNLWWRQPTRFSKAQAMQWYCTLLWVFGKTWYVASTHHADCQAICFVFHVLLWHTLPASMLRSFKKSGRISVMPLGLFGAHHVLPVLFLLVNEPVELFQPFWIIGCERPRLARSPRCTGWLVGKHGATVAITGTVLLLSFYGTFAMSRYPQPGWYSTHILSCNASTMHIPSILQNCPIICLHSDWAISLDDLCMGYWASLKNASVSNIMQDQKCETPDVVCCNSKKFSKNCTQDWSLLVFCFLLLFCIGCGCGCGIKFHGTFIGWVWLHASSTCSCQPWVKGQQIHKMPLGVAIVFWHVSHCHYYYQQTTINQNGSNSLQAVVQTQ